MRYRDINDLKDFSSDVASVVDFFGEAEYRSALDELGSSLQTKGFVTPNDDLMFSLELDLFNLEILRTRCGGSFKSLPSQCHRGVDFLLGLGQTIPTLSESAKARLLGRLRKGFKEGLWPLQHEFRIAANLSKMGYDLYFHDLEEDGGYDFLAIKDGSAFEIEAKAVSVYTGWPIKPENVDKLLVEVKNHFIWTDEQSIPVLALTLPTHLVPNRETLRSLVSAFCEAARTRQTVRASDASVKFIGTVPNLDPVRLSAAALAHAKLRKTLVMVNPIGNRLILELESQRPIRLEKKIIRTINEAARLQFTGGRPGVIWTHICFSDNEWFRKLSKSEEGKVCLFDGIAHAALLSTKRDHLTQIVFSGGTSFLNKDGPTARSSYLSAVYDSPASRFGETFLFPNGRKKAT